MINKLHNSLALAIEFLELGATNKASKHLEDAMSIVDDLVIDIKSINDNLLTSQENVEKLSETLSRLSHNKQQNEDEIRLLKKENSRVRREYMVCKDRAEKELSQARSYWHAAYKEEQLARNSVRLSYERECLLSNIAYENKQLKEEMSCVKKLTPTKLKLVPCQSSSKIA
jgi:hypothetical protein